MGKNRTGRLGFSLNSIQTVTAVLIMSLLSLAFALSDWMYGYFTFSEYILVAVLGILILTMNFRLSADQLKIIGLFAALLVTHTILQSLFNADSESGTAILGIGKMVFYSVSVSVIINYIKDSSQSYNFLILNNIAAIIVIILGLYITFELYRESTVPREIFWRFTRRDIYSYYFESNPAIIRTRSIFSEPAHLGFYLNTLVSVNLFSKYRSKLLIIFTFTLSLGILLTFSYSMIAILLVIISSKVLMMLINRSFKWSNWYLLIPAALIVLTLLNWEVINTTLIQRTIAVFTGQDTSARMRLLDSWQYVSRDNIWLGNGIGETPIITNNYAYALSDMGLIGALIIGTATVWLTLKSWPLGLVFILLNSAKGGYLSSSYWFMIMLVLLFLHHRKSHETYNELQH